MALRNDKQFQMRVSEDFLRTIDDWRRKHPGLPSRAEAIRQLIQTGLAARPILAEVQSMLLHLTRNDPDPALERYIEAIHKALDPKSD